MGVRTGLFLAATGIAAGGFAVPAAEAAGTERARAQVLCRYVVTPVSPERETVDVFAGPGRDFPRIRQAKAGTTITVYCVPRNGYFLINPENQEQPGGFIYYRYLAPVQGVEAGGGGTSGGARPMLAAAGAAAVALGGLMAMAPRARRRNS
ncbi:hypothetical protein GCM10023085_61940 [Actinomadura viridis]|uniref:SH3 domain-containing protein n=1 Tax=Actinomadura viridis TaxID=58110 RepID=A0A931DFU9_9ACTN|nr:SH3 domain-containing protein [Actinomadura viridis]MBG6090359.1 hypothetical protein [Actinomadura viridis]